MKGTKEQRGITLIALIITIVVLLILAAVAISSIQNDGILHYATNAADSWNKAQTNEQATLDSYLAYLENLKYQQCPGHTYNEDGKCTKCGYQCDHNPETWGDPVDDGQLGHIWHFTCEDCGLDTMTSGKGPVTEAHNWNGGVCTVCGYSCDVGMGGWHSEIPLDGMCNECGWKNKFYGCTHTSTKTEFERDYGVHYIKTLCSNCNKELERSEGIIHTWNNGVCSVCNYECQHDFIGRNS